MNPFIIDEKTFEEVINLYSDVRRLQMNSSKKANNDSEIIRVPAKDNWF